MKWLLSKYHSGSSELCAQAISGLVEMDGQAKGELLKALRHDFENSTEERIVEVLDALHSVNHQNLITDTWFEESPDHKSVSTVSRILLSECWMEPNQHEESNSMISPFHNAASCGLLRTLKAFMAKGWTVNHVWRGETALDRAISENRDEVIEFLRSKGGKTGKELKEEGQERQLFRRIADEIAREAKARKGGSRWGFSSVAADVLTESRGEEEDRLRMYMIAHFPKGVIRDEAKRIANSPWSAETVSGLWKVGAFEVGQPRAAVFELLFYAADRYGGEVLTEVKSKLDLLCQKFENPDWHPADIHLFVFLANALAKYGTAELIPESFAELSGQYDSEVQRVLKAIEKRKSSTELQDEDK